MLLRRLPAQIPDEIPSFQILSYPESKLWCRCSAENGSTNFMQDCLVSIRNVSSPRGLDSNVARPTLMLGIVQIEVRVALHTVSCFCDADGNAVINIKRDPSVCYSLISEK
jgi:hypothetical protein